ncbi:MAG: Enoyl-CoA hydratase, partial [uncultured Acetobacteraceae bacterium]
GTREGLGRRAGARGGAEPAGEGQRHQPRHGGGGAGRHARVRPLRQPRRGADRDGQQGLLRRRRRVRPAGAVARGAERRLANGQAGGRGRGGLVRRRRAGFGDDGRPRRVRGGGAVLLPGSEARPHRRHDRRTAVPHPAQDRHGADAALPHLRSGARGGGGPGERGRAGGRGAGAGRRVGTRDGGLRAAGDGRDQAHGGGRHPAARPVRALGVARGAAGGDTRFGRFRRGRGGVPGAAGAGVPGEV